MRRALAALLLLVLPACTGGEPDDARPAVRDAVERTLALGSAAVRGSATLDEKTLLVEGATSFATGDAALRMSIADRPGPLRFEARRVGGRFYERGNSGEWLWHTTPRMNVRTFWPLGGLDAGEMLGFLRGATDVERGGTEDVRGTETRRYTGTLDLALVPGSDDAIYRFGTSRAAFTAWVDGQGRVARFTLDVDADRLVGSSGRGTLTTTFDLVEFGVPVEVAAPAKSTEYAF